MLQLFSPSINILMVFKSPAAWINTCNFIQDSSSAVLHPVWTRCSLTQKCTCSPLSLDVYGFPLLKHFFLTPKCSMHLQPISTARGASVDGSEHITILWEIMIGKELTPCRIMTITHLPAPPAVSSALSRVSVGDSGVHTDDSISTYHQILSLLSPHVR